MFANMFQNIKYLNSKYSKKSMELCAKYCPLSILGKISENTLKMINAPIAQLDRA